MQKVKVNCIWLLFFIGFMYQPAFSQTISGVVKSKAELKTKANYLLILKPQVWFMPDLVLDTIEIDHKGEFQTKLPSSGHYILKYGSINKYIFPTTNANLNIEITEEEIIVTNQVELYRFYNGYINNYIKNGGYDINYRKSAALSVDSFLLSLNHQFEMRSNALLYLKYQHKSSASLYEFLAMNLFYEKLAKKLDYLEHHEYYASQGTSMDYYLADTNYYNDFSVGLFNDRYIGYYAYADFLEKWIRDPYSKAFANNPDSMQYESRSKFKFNYVKDKLTGETRDLAIAMIVKELIDQSSNQTDFKKADNLIKDFQKFNYSERYVNYLKNYLKKSNSIDEIVDFCLPNNNGDTLCFHDIKGKNVVLFFTGSWCKPCLKEKPAYERLIDRFSSNELIFICLYLENMDYSSWVAHLDNKKSKAIYLYAENGKENQQLMPFNINSVPRFVLVDSTGHIVNHNASYPSNGLETEIKKEFPNY